MQCMHKKKTSFLSHDSKNHHVKFGKFLTYSYLCSMNSTLNNMVTSKERDSNMELLRIVSMILVLVTHACYVSLGSPTSSDISISFCNSILRAISESLSEVGVNTFILISGWFGIRSRLSRFLGFIFQILFIDVLLYIIMRIFNLTESIDLNGWIDLFLFRYGTYWFVKAYIILFIFAPILNAFVDYCSRRQLEYFLISFYIAQTIYGFYINIGWFSSGYSPLSFIGLYLLSRYMRLYPNKFTQLSKVGDISLYLLVSLFTALCSLSMTFFWGKVGTVLFNNSSPLIIVSSVYFFLFFTKLSFSCRFINWVSASCFAAYIVHCSPFIFYPYYIEVIRSWSVSETHIKFLAYTTLLIFGFFVFSILFDKVRIMVWNIIYKSSNRIRTINYPPN